MNPEPRDVALRPLLGAVAVEEFLEKILEGRSRRHPGNFHAAAAFDHLGRRDINHRGKQPLGQVGEALRGRFRLGRHGESEQGQKTYGQPGGKVRYPYKLTGVRANPLRASAAHAHVVHGNFSIV